MKSFVGLLYYALRFLVVSISQVSVATEKFEFVGIFGKLKQYTANLLFSVL